MNKEEIFKEVNRCLNCKNPRCREACPLNNDIPQMISKLKEGKVEEAYEIDLKSNPLGAVCGLICPHEKYCEGACIRGIKETPVKIGAIENYICMNAKSDSIKTQDDKSINNEYAEKSKVAIIGGGPARNFLRILLIQEWN